MSKMIQVRNVPEELHRILKVRAANEGKSLSDYILEELRHMAELPTIQEWLALVKTRDPVTPFSTEEAIRAERDSR
jgi:plasmid stability protein